MKKLSILFIALLSLFSCKKDKKHIATVEFNCEADTCVYLLRTISGNNDTVVIDNSYFTGITIESLEVKDSDLLTVGILNATQSEALFGMRLDIDGNVVLECSKTSVRDIYDELNTICLYQDTLCFND